MSDLDISERRKPQDGKIKFKKFAPLDIELRVATIPTVGGEEDVVMRILAAGEPISLDAMGMSERNHDKLISMITKPYGIVLVVGPTGSGKTTTLHSALAYINKPETKIWTAEDPVEITQRGLRQVQVQPKIGFDFAAAMRSFLRADPDVIMVGEMRDHETVATGIEASLTGHLVFSTLHTNSAPETITRLLDMGMDPFNFADALLGVLAQRLVRTLCKECKESYHPKQDEYDNLVRVYDGDFDALGYPYNDDLKLYKAKGCDKCNNTGYKGRTGLVELLDGTDKMKGLIQEKATMENLRKQAVADGMTTLMQDGIRKVLLGITDLQQVRKVCIK
jgi:type II secretory ATPase GspE/PulE/Tfp pilus assembly ATPase PilB-like protein